MALVLGMANLVTQFLYETKIFLGVGFGWWLCGVAFLALSADFTLPVFIGAVLVLNILPGIYLTVKYAREKSGD